MKQEDEMDLTSFALGYVLATINLVTVFYMHGELELRKRHLRRLQGGEK